MTLTTKKLINYLNNWYDIQITQDTAKKIINECVEEFGENQNFLESELMEIVELYL